MLVFCVAISSINAFAALRRASMRFPPVMGSFIDPEASSTSTMSSGVVDVDAIFDVEESTESAVMKSESPLETVALMAPEMPISPVDTVLSVQMRPIFSVVFSTTPDQSPIVDASAIVSTFAAARICCARDDALDSSAKAVLPIKGSSANASRAAIAIFNRFMVWPPSCFPPYIPIV